MGRGLKKMKVRGQAVLHLEPGVPSLPLVTSGSSQDLCFPASSLAKGEDASPPAPLL